jgi:hypothetical protein
MLQAGRSWWVIVSLSGYGMVIFLGLMTLYLFAIFRGVARSRKDQVEHPLTTSSYYLFFYDISPFLGGVAGLIASLGAFRAGQSVLLVATGSLWVTFLVWIVVDPAAGTVEMFLPAARAHRRDRLARAKAARQQQQVENRRLLVEIESSEQAEKDRWARSLRPYAERLAALVSDRESTAARQSETEAVDIGLAAWRMGGIGCMKHLYSMAMELCRRQRRPAVDCIPIWWDGIGNWRSHWLESI